MFNKLFNLLFPKGYSCLCCGMDVFDNPYDICEACKNDLPFLKGNICVRCGEPFEADGMVCKRCKKKEIVYDRALAPFEYSDEIKNLIVGLKHHKKTYHAKALSRFMVDAFVSSGLYADYIIPVPLCDKRFKERGFNQSELLANEITRVLNVPMLTSVLYRVKETPRQQDLDFKERQINIKDAFKVKSKKEIKNKFVLLVDDVYTTGATATECARELKLAGAKAVYVLTAAHTLVGKE